MGAAEPSASQPNIIFILTDDQRYDTIAAVGQYPWLKTPNMDQLVNEGVHFENAFVTTSLCGPARASFLTGTYANRHGCVINEWEDSSPAIPNVGELLQQAGYETGFLGKWHQAMNYYPRKGFDMWASFWGQGKYYGDELMTETGALIKLPEDKYITDALNELAVQFIEKKHDKPFFLYLSHKAVHEPFTPPERDRDLYKGRSIESNDTPDENLLDKPFYVGEDGRRNGKAKADLHPSIPDMLRCITAVDDGIGQILDALRESGQLDNTVVIFAGDNGYFFGEHGGLHDKRKAYEPSIRIPLVMYAPGLFKEPRKVDDMVLNIDFAPTLLELAHARIPGHIQGESWLGTVDGSRAGRDYFFYEYYYEPDYRPRGGFGGTPTTFAIRTADWKYITYPNAEDHYQDELYHISADPDELHNLARNQKYAEQLRKMKEMLEMHKTRYGYIPPKKLPGGGISYSEMYGKKLD